MSQKLPSDGFKWKKNMLKFNEEFIKTYDVEYPKDLNYLHSDLPF